MAVLNAVVEQRLKDLLEQLEGLTEEDIVEERNLLDRIVNDVERIVETSGLPLLELDEIVNPVDTGLDHKYFDTLQKQMVSNFSIYNQLVDDLASRLNIFIDKVAEKLEEKSNVIDVQLQEIQNLREMTLRQLNNVSILGEFVVKHETLKDENVVVRNCIITPNGSITLPAAAADDLVYDNTVLQNLSFRVGSPREATAKLSYPSNINGKANSVAVVPGHFEGKLFGDLNKPYDIRLGSKLSDIFDGKDDTVWECEYVTDTPSSSTFIVVITMRFNKPIWINRIIIKSDNDIEISMIDSSNKKVVIGDYENEASELVQTDNLILSISQNYYEKLYYTLMSIVRNEYTLHTYNVFETYHQMMRELFKRHFPAVKVEPVKEVEQHAGENDVQPTLRSDKYRYSVAISDMTLLRKRYLTTGTYETDDISVPRNDIYAVELETDAYYPNADVEWIRFWLSFDGGKNWYRIRSKTESVTEFNNILKTRITLSDTEKVDANQDVYDISSDKVRVKIDLQTNDDFITPVLHWYQVRIKMKGDDSG